MGRKCCIFAHFALKILLTERSSGTITNSIAVEKSNDRGSSLPTGCPRFTSARFFWLAGGSSWWIIACCTAGTRWAFLAPRAPTNLPCLHTSVATGRVVNLQHCTIFLFPWQCSADNLRWGLPWADVCICGRRGFHPRFKVLEEKHSPVHHF